MNQNDVRNLAFSMLHKPYQWDGKTPIEGDGLDCSGFVSILLRSQGIIPHNSSLNAQGIHDYLLTKGWNKVKIPSFGNIAFFGQEEKSIHHIVFCLDDAFIIGANGGDHTTLTLHDAIMQDACVKILPLSYRSDLVVVLGV